MGRGLSRDTWDFKVYVMLLQHQNQSTGLFCQKFPPVRLDAHSSIQPTPTFAKLALARFCVCIRSRILLIWKWVANPMARLHCNSLHADKPLDCNRTGGKISEEGHWFGYVAASPLVLLDYLFSDSPFVILLLYQFLQDWLGIGFVHSLYQLDNYIRSFHTHSSLTIQTATFLILGTI